MHELKEKINKCFASYKKIWIEEFSNAAKEKRHFQLANVMVKDADLMQEVNQYFLEAENRLKKTKGKGLW